MRSRLFAMCFLAVMCLSAQRPIYDFVSFNKTLKVPAKLNSERTVVIFTAGLNGQNGVMTVDNIEKTLNEMHRGFITMGIDPIFYLSDINYTASFNARNSYVELFNKRRVANVLFLNKDSNGYQLIMAPYSGKTSLIKDGSDVFFMEHKELYSLLVNVGKEIRRADQAKQNFLIPDKPNVLEGLSTVENTLLKNYPGILRRSKLAVERFSMLDTTNISDQQVLANIRSYNRAIQAKNIELDTIMKSYPYEYELIDALSDDELKRRRYQFVLRSISASASTVKQMLDYDIPANVTDFVSVIPVMPDQTRVKTLPRDAFVYKFYIRQNISKNVHVGEWDADVTWQSALNNMIGNLTQELNIKN